MAAWHHVASWQRAASATLTVPGGVGAGSTEAKEDDGVF